MFVTQRGLLYAIPAGLILLHHWKTTLLDRRLEQGIPFWAEWLLYCSMPLFHLHTFLFLSFLLFWWFLFGDPNWRGHFLRLILLSLIPATFFVYVVTGFAKTGAIGWQLDWTAGPNEAPWWFWLRNFGLFLPASLALLIYLLIPAKPLARDAKQRIRLLFFPAAAVFLACSVIKFAPWEWDNTKLFFWAYLVIMFCLWEAFLTRWHPLLRAPVIFGLFFSGFISLLGGIFANPEGYGIGRASEWKQVADATRFFPANTVFATYPTYNHPVLVSGHRVVMGFPGHLWSHGLNYRPVEVKMTALMNSRPAGRTSQKSSASITCSGDDSKPPIIRILKKNGKKPVIWLPRVPGVGFTIYAGQKAKKPRSREPRNTEGCLAFGVWRLAFLDSWLLSTMSCFKCAFCLT